MAVRSRREIEPELLHPEERGEVVEPEYVEAEYELLKPVACLPGPSDRVPWLDRVRWLAIGTCTWLALDGVARMWSGATCVGLTLVFVGVVVGVALFRDEVWQWKSGRSGVR